MSDLTGIRALTFDVFGTVVDWREGVARDVEAILPGVDGRAFADHWRAGYQPAMEAVRTGARPWVPLDVLHREILLTVLAQHEVGDVPTALVDELNLSWHRLDPWPDVLDGLTRLRTKFILGVLSNANIALMIDMTKRSGMVFDCILGGETARAYKAAPHVYENAAHVLNLRPDQCLMVAAHPSDLDAAAACGLRTAYIHRPLEYGAGREKPRPDDGRFDLNLDSLTALAGRLGC
ncbi:MAG: dhlB [Caulobacteraceae bacterium]|nr:dhlB [Caulobacteraceae bacterium]